MEALLDGLARQPLLLLFTVLAVGYALGRVAIAGVQLGVAAVLFAGLALGMLDARLQLPEFVRAFGLVLFVYAIGVSNGPGFFASFRRRGLRDTAWTVGLVGLGGLIAHSAGRAFGVPSEVTAGLFCGALTNTPALAAALERLPAGTQGPVVGYSIAYPMGALGIVLALAIARRRWHGELERAAGRDTLEVRYLRVTSSEAVGVPVKALLQRWRIRARFVRRRHGDGWELVSPDASLALNDTVTVVGTPDALAELTPRVGEESADREALGRGDLDMRRIFVSSPAVAGRSLAELRTLTHFGALVSRVRRGDADLVPDGRTVLRLGDRVRVVAPRERMAEVSRFFGDSYRALGEVDAVSFGLGAGLGLLLGMVPIPLPGELTFRLGPAGGPLVAGLVLGAIGRTGPLLWQVPYSAGLTLRQVGLALFLAAVGLGAGGPFADELRSGQGPLLLAVGLGVTLTVATLSLVSARLLLRAPAGLGMGLASGVHTQPAALAFASESARDPSPDVGYSTVSPIATLTKILVAQLLLGG